MKLKDILYKKLTEVFRPEALEVEDLSHLHQGHKGAHPEGETHFRISLVSRNLKEKVD